LSTNRARQTQGRSPLSIRIREEQGEHVASDFNDLLRITQVAINKLGGERAWFRGHADANWKLCPDVFRKPESGRQEQNMYADFLLQAPTRHSACPRPEDRMAWLALMRHYGVPTRLLDWTESVLIAAYFAVCGNTDADSAVWALNPFGLNSVSIGNRLILGPYRPEVLNAMFPAFDREAAPSSHIFAVYPQQVDHRMMLQHSRFTLHGTDAPLEDSPSHGTFLFKFIIPRRYREEIRKALFVVGIRESLLFPDLSTLAQSIRRERCGDVLP